MSFARSVLCLVCLLTIGALAAFTAPAHAQFLIVSGDSNIANALVGEPGIPVNSSNQRFFSNVLGAGTQVRVLRSLQSNASNVANDLIVFYDALFRVTANGIVGTVTPAALTGVDLFLAPVPDDPFTPEEIAALSNFLNNGGDVFLLGENGNFPATNTSINSLLTALGSSMQLVPAFARGPSSGANITPAPFTVGVISFDSYSGSNVSGGTSLFRSDTNGSTLLAYQMTGGAVAAPEPASLALLALSGLPLAGVVARCRRSA